MRMMRRIQKQHIKKQNIKIYLLSLLLSVLLLLPSCGNRTSIPINTDSSETAPNPYVSEDVIVDPNYSPTPINTVFSETVLNPYMSEDVIADSKLQLQDNGLDYVNYFVQACAVITGIKKDCNNNKEAAEKALDRMAETFYRCGYFPRPAYKKFDYGWVSSMDAPVIAVASFAYDEVYHTDRYQSFIADLCAYIPTSVNEHGFVAEIDGERWLFEYADTNTDIDNGEFVLNGSLLGTLSTAILAEKMNDDTLRELVASQTRLYEKLMQKYWKSDGTWCYYMLNPQRVNPPHYIIFEIRLLDALAEVTGDAFYMKEAAARRDLLKEYYRLFLYEEDGATHYLLLRGGAPHFYYIDIYNTELVFFDEQGNILECARMGGRDETDSIMSGLYPEGTAHVEWNVVPPDWTVHMGDLLIQEESANNAEAFILPCTFAASAGGELREDRLLLTKGEDRCNLIGKLSGVECEADDVFVLEIENLSEEKFSTNIILYDSDGNAVDRYLKGLLPGKNALMFAMPGFVYGVKDTFKEIDSFKLRIYLTGMEAENAEMRVGNMYRFDNAYYWSQYLNNTENIIIDWGE